MSRSYRKVPCGGLTKAVSDKPFKQESSRKLRHNVNQTVREIAKNPTIAEDTVLPVQDEVINQYDAPKDGKKWWVSSTNNPEDWYKKLLRK